MFQSVRDESTSETVMFAHGVIVGLSTQFIVDLPSCAGSRWWSLCEGGGIA